MSPELESIIERSKRDDALIAGSEIRMLGMAVRNAEAKLERAVALLANLLGSWSPDDWEVGADYPALMRDAGCLLDEIEKGTP